MHLVLYVCRLYYIVLKWSKSLQVYTTYTVIRFVRVSAKFGTCTVVGVNWTLVEAKMFTFTLESTHFIFSKCPIYTNDSASAKFSTNSHQTDYSVWVCKGCLFMYYLHSYIVKYLPICSYIRKLFSYMTLQLLYSEFPYIWGKFDFLFYQCSRRYRQHFEHFFNSVHTPPPPPFRPSYDNICENHLLRRVTGGQ